LTLLSGKLKTKQIMPSNIFAETDMQFNDKYLSQLLGMVELLRRGNKNGVEFSNTGFGWQSDGLPQNGVFIPFIQNVTEKCNDFCKQVPNFKFSKVEIVYFWANINYKHDINWPHRHAGDISGVFYLKAPDNSGDLTLHSPYYDVNNKLSEHLNTESVIKIKPIVNKLVLFDANCSHYVTRSHSNEPRVSISFNANVHL
jgi:uncharacterized protein (TIGR02466 family)|tara:strand:+ start:243 stop:839 length:597 start_codon:yes stop_codon:yes gene_type:complete